MTMRLPEINRYVDRTAPTIQYVDPAAGSFLRTAMPTIHLRYQDADGVNLSTLQVSNDSPAVWLLVSLATSIGLPFLVLSMGAPGLQRWFATTTDPAGRDPFFLYAASNFGSVVPAASERAAAS